MIHAIYDGNHHYITRKLDLTALLTTRTVMLFSPRQTGKSSYIRAQPTDLPAATFSLLDQRLLLTTLADPTRIRQEIEASGPGECAPARATVTGVEPVTVQRPQVDERSAAVGAQSVGRHRFGRLVVTPFTTSAHQ